MSAAIAALLDWIDSIPGVFPIPDGFTMVGFVGMDAQAEANWWFNFICKQIPKDHWLQPGMTASKED